MARARIFARYLSDELEQSVVVENRPGASGMIATNSVSRAPADGYTLSFVASPTLTITPLIQKNAKLDHDNDLAYIGNLVNYTNVLLINKDIPVNNIQELVDYAKQNPNTVSFGSAGVGASNHLSAELLRQKTDTEMLHVPYRGNAPAMVDVISGETTFMFDIISTAINYINGGQVRALAVTSSERNAGLPDVPSMVEAGVEDYEVTGWYALTGPKELPASIIERLQSAVKNISGNANYIKSMDDGGYDIHITESDEFEAQVKREFAMWAEVIEQADIQTD